MSGLRGAPRKGKVKVAVTTRDPQTRRKFVTHLFVKMDDVQDAPDLFTQRLVRKYGEGFKVEKFHAVAWRSIG